MRCKSRTPSLKTACLPAWKLEASLLNLQGTELVILSACDSGTGEIKIGEGVMSLRRAFRIAGAETVLASHWKVSDKATSQLMTEFVRRWRAGEPGGRLNWRYSIPNSFPIRTSGRRLLSRGNGDELVAVTPDPLELSDTL
jgi:hypothetical protein